MTNIEKVHSYLNDAGIFYLTTVAGDQPKCRPIGIHVIENDKLCFGIGTFKEVYKQMVANPHVEICASKDDGFLRLYGTAVFETDDTLAKKVLDRIPNLKAIYNEETGYKLGMFHLENATAEFRGMLSIEESCKL